MKSKQALRILLSLSVLSPVFLAPSAYASPELDRQYSLSTVGILKAWDNVDGLFGDIVTEAYQAKLRNQSRFIVQDLSKANAILSSAKIPYNQIIEDEKILTQIASTLKVDTFLRTKVYKEGPQYRFVIDWIHAPKLQLLATETFRIDEPFSDGQSTGSDQFKAALSTALDRLIAKVPYRGTVTGRDQTALTVNIGAREGIKKGDTLVVGTIDEVKFHPLLKSIVDWRITSTGKATVSEVDDGMSFATIDIEEYGRQIARFQKIVQVIPGPEEKPQVTTTITDYDERLKASMEPPRMGWISPGIFAGAYSREASSNSGATGKTGGGTMIGFKADGQLWFTSQWFSELNFAYGSSGFSQEDIATGAATGASDVSATLSQFRLSFGYHYHITPNFFGPKGWAKVGFQNTSYGLPNTAAEQTSNAAYSSLTFGIGGDLPIRNDYGVLLYVDFGLFGSGKEDGGYFGTESGSNSVDVHVGGYLWLKPKMKLRLGFDFKSHSVDFVNGASLSNKVVGFGPSLMFYF